MRGEPKVTSSHRERTAICYIRQSSLVQVREHTESTARQYGLAALAAQLGWPAARIEVIDCDLGLSGRSATYREGFKELVARVCMGEVGAVFGLEVSRLARSNADLTSPGEGSPPAAAHGASARHRLGTWTERSGGRSMLEPPPAHSRCQPAHRDRG